VITHTFHQKSSRHITSSHVTSLHFTFHILRSSNFRRSLITPQIHFTSRTRERAEMYTK